MPMREFTLKELFQKQMKEHGIAAFEMALKEVEKEKKNMTLDEYFAKQRDFKDCGGTGGTESRGSASGSVADPNFAAPSSDSEKSDKPSHSVGKSNDKSTNRGAA